MKKFKNTYLTVLSLAGLLTLGNQVQGQTTLITQADFKAISDAKLDSLKAAHKVWIAENEARLDSLKNAQPDFKAISDAKLDSLKDAHKAWIAENEARLDSLKNAQPDFKAISDAKLDSLKDVHEAFMKQHEAKVDSIKKAIALDLESINGKKDSIQTISLQESKMWPNPLSPEMQGKVKIETDENHNLTLVIYNMGGEKVATIPMNSGEAQMPQLKQNL